MTTVPPANEAADPPALESSSAPVPVSAATSDASERSPSAPMVMEEHDDEGRLMSRTSLLNGVLHGRMQRFGASGALQMQADYRHGQLDGLLSAFDEAGQLVMSAEYRDGRQHGVQRIYAAGSGGAASPSPPRCLAEQQFVHGLLHGINLSFDEAGDVSARLPYVAGRLEGQALFFSQGRRLREAAYSAGLLEGASTDFDTEGSVVQVLRYRANLLHGPAQRYWPDGALMEEQVYQEGRPLGLPRRYDAKGRPLAAEQASPGLLERLERLVRG